MATSLSGEDSDQPELVAGGEGSLKNVKWDPFSSPDWDNEKHTKEALVRIKRYGS